VPQCPVAGDANAHRPMHGSAAYKLEAYGVMTTQIPVVSVFPNFGKVGKFAVFIKRRKAKKMFQLQGRDPLTRSSAYRPNWGLSPDHRYSLALRARHGVSPSFNHLPRSMSTTTPYIRRKKKTTGCNVFSTQLLDTWSISADLSPLQHRQPQTSPIC